MSKNNERRFLEHLEIKVNEAKEISVKIDDILKGKREKGSLVRTPNPEGETNGSREQNQ